MSLSHKELASILHNHSLWLSGKGGEQANLAHANLADAYLAGANLARANLADADLSFAYLIKANLADADLADADLTGADLNGCIGNKREIKSIFASKKYSITYTFDRLQIGCEKHLINDWWSFSDDNISEMDVGALEWWAVWKPIIKKIIEVSPAKTFKTKDHT